MQMTNQTNEQGRRLLRVFVIVPLFFIILFIASTFIHELGHAITAIVLGIPITELTFGWYGLGPGVALPEYFPVEYLPYFRYAGGTMAGVGFMFTYIFWLIRQRCSVTDQYAKAKWWIQGFVLFWGIFGFYQGYIEGAYFERYIKGEVSWTVPFLAIMLASFAVHLGVTHRFARQRKLKEK